MTKLTYDLSERPLDSTVPPGTYIAKVVKVEDSTSNNGHPMLKWEWRIVKGEHQGKSITSYTSLQEHAQSIVRQYLMALGYCDKVSIELKELVGKRARLVVDTRTVIDKETNYKTVYPRVAKTLPLEEHAPIYEPILEDD